MNRLLSGIDRVVTAAVSGAVQPRIAIDPVLRRDMENGGSYRLTELVYYNGELARRRVKLFRREGRGYRFVREIWSDAATGRYTFEFIAPGQYLALADDYLAQKNAVVADWLTAEPMS